MPIFPYGTPTHTLPPPCPVPRYTLLCVFFHHPSKSSTPSLPLRTTTPSPPHPCACGRESVKLPPAISSARKGRYLTFALTRAPPQYVPCTQRRHGSIGSTPLYLKLSALQGMC